MNYNNSTISVTTTISSIVGELFAQRNMNGEFHANKVALNGVYFIYDPEAGFKLCNARHHTINVCFPTQNGIEPTLISVPCYTCVNVTELFVHYMQQDIDSITIIENSDDCEVNDHHAFGYGYIHFTDPCTVYDTGEMQIKLTSTEMVITPKAENVEIINLFIQSTRRNKSLHLHNYRMKNNEEIIPHFINLAENEEIYMSILLRLPNGEKDSRYKIEQLSEEELNFLRKD